MNSEQLLAQMQLVREQMAHLEAKWFELDAQYKQERKNESQKIDVKDKSFTLKFY